MAYLLEGIKMEVLGEGLKAIGGAVNNIAISCSMVCIVGIATIGILIYVDKITIDDVKDLFKRDRSNRYR